MIYGRSYEGRTRECEVCGHITNVHALCDDCDASICENCEIQEDDKHFCSVECAKERIDHFSEPSCIKCKAPVSRATSLYCSDGCEHVFQAQLKGLFEEFEAIY
jgi:hypothetical protein